MKKDIEFVRASLTAFNENIVGADGHAPLNLAECDETGNVIAGLLGGTYWDWMYVDILWVDEKYRRQGIGSRLLGSAEKKTIRRGCHHVHLDAMSWQTPEFYKKHGYSVVGILPDIPTGNQKYLLIKELIILIHRHKNIECT